MNAQDLMLGDWIFYGKTPVRVLQLSEGKVYKGFHPIPLTAKILEKNLANEQRNGYISWVKDEYCETCFDIEMLINSTIIEKRFEYVHQLQHALRLCGIDKDIEI